jgi:hypothetical protein
VKRIRLNTLMLLIVIAALCVALVVLQGRAKRQAAVLRLRLRAAESRASFLERQIIVSKWRDLSKGRSKSKRRADSVQAVET